MPSGDGRQPGLNRRLSGDPEELFEWLLALTKITEKYLINALCYVSRSPSRALSQGSLGSLAYYLHQCMLSLQPRDVLFQGMQGPATGYGPLPAPLPFFSLVNDVTDLHVESPVLTPQ